MTIYKAVRNFLTVFVVLAVAAGALCIGGGVYYAVQSAASSQVLSKLGSTGAEVTRVQKKLKELGYYSGAADGIYGNATKAAVKAFQKNCGITADGVAGPKTLLYLGLGSGSSNSTGYSDADVELLAKVISAEARGESYEGQVAVGAVILNRVAHPSFPNSISGVVYSNWYAPVADSAKRAATDALNGWDPSGGAVYYFNASKTSDKFMHSRPVIKVIGNHKFCS